MFDLLASSSVCSFYLLCLLLLLFATSICYACFFCLTCFLLLFALLASSVWFVELWKTKTVSFDVNSMIPIQYIYACCSPPSLDFSLKSASHFAVCFFVYVHYSRSSFYIHLLCSLTCIRPVFAFLVLNFSFAISRISSSSSFPSLHFAGSHLWAVLITHWSLLLIGQFWLHYRPAISTWNAPERFHGSLGLKQRQAWQHRQRQNRQRG